jgi:hypothetical protein
VLRGLNEEIGQNDRIQVVGEGRPPGEATLFNCLWCNPLDLQEVLRMMISGDFSFKITFSEHLIRATGGLYI